MPSSTRTGSSRSRSGPHERPAGMTARRRLVELSSRDLEALLTADSIVIQPCGSNEQHGDHLPPGNDTIIAGRIATSAGVSPPRMLRGRQVLYSFLQSSMMTRASVTEANSVMFSNSSGTELTMNVHPEMPRATLFGEEPPQCIRPPERRPWNHPRRWPGPLGCAHRRCSTASACAGQQSRRTGNRVPTHGPGAQPRARSRRSPRVGVSLFLAGGGRRRTLLTPQPTQLLVIHHPAFAVYHHVSRAPPQSGMFTCANWRSRRRSFSSIAGTGRAGRRWVERC